MADPDRVSTGGVGRVVVAVEVADEVPLVVVADFGSGLVGVAREGVDVGYLQLRAGLG